MARTAIERLLGGKSTRSNRFVSELEEHLRRLVVVVWHRFNDDMLSLRAMGLTYATLLSLVPFLAVTFSLLKAFGIQNQIQPVLAQALEPLGEQGVEITRQIIGFVDNLKVGVLGAVGTATLFYTVISLVGRFEDSLNQIWRVDTPRRIGQRFTDYLSVVLVGPVLVFSAFALTASAQSSWIVERLLEFPGLDYVFVALTKVAPFLFLWFAFTFLYRLLPNTRVRVSSALLGGAVAALLWQVAGAVFAAFVATSTRYAAIYSSFAILILFLIWLHVSWLVLLVGAEVAYFHQHPAAYWREGAGTPETHRFRESLALKLLVAITRRYFSGQPPLWPDQLARQFGVTHAAVDEIVDLFVKRGVLVRTSEPEGTALARPPESLAVADVLEILSREEHEPVAPAELDTVDEVLARRDASVGQALEGLTLKALSDMVAREASGAVDPSRKS